MPRLPYLEEKDVAPEHRHFLARGANLYRTLTHSPGAANAFQTFAHFLRFESKLDPRLRELAILQVAYLTRTEYAFYSHVGIVRQLKVDVSDDDITNMMRETRGEITSLSPLVRAVLSAAREMTDDIAISDATFALLRRELDNGSLVDLVSTIAFYNAAVRFLRTMDVDVEPNRAEAFAAYRKLFPLP